MEVATALEKELLSLEKLPPEVEDGKIFQVLSAAAEMFQNVNNKTVRRY